MSTYWESNITDIDDVAGIVAWCERNMSGRWNVVAESGSSACRGGGYHRVTLLCEDREDHLLFELSWR